MENYSREIYQTREEWLTARALGGSSASAILNKNPYMTRLELLAAVISKLRNGGETAIKNPRDNSTNEILQYGVQSEPLIRKEFALDFKHKYIVRPPKKYEMYRSLSKKYLTATVDGLLVDKETKELGILEIKTHDIRNRSDLENWTNHLPENYYIQVLHYLLVINNASFAILVAKLRFYDFKNEERKLERTETRYYYMKRSEVESDIAFLEKAETEFMETYVQQEKIPSIYLEF